MCSLGIQRFRKHACHVVKTVYKPKVASSMVLGDIGVEGAKVATYLRVEKL